MNLHPDTLAISNLANGFGSLGVTPGSSTPAQQTTLVRKTTSSHPA